MHLFVICLPLSSKSISTGAEIFVKIFSLKRLFLPGEAKVPGSATSSVPSVWRIHDALLWNAAWIAGRSVCRHGDADLHAPGW